jgi:O-antigen ligase
LIWVLAINGALVAFEGILQRTSGTAKLLWFMETRENREAAAQFGPYAYRANAAQFFNLVWPVALGFWWQLQFSRGTRRQMQRRHLLIPCALLPASASLISLSRGGVIITILLLAAIGGLAMISKRIGWAPKVTGLAVLAGVVALAWYVGWEEIADRFRRTAADPLSGRAETYQLAQGMAKDYVWFGTGPNTFVSVFQLYRTSPDDYWPAQLHNDWMEFRITLGRVGVGMLVTALGLIGASFFTRGGIRVDNGLVACIWIALAGCLLHARFDFPLQIYSIQFVVVLLCAILAACSRARPFQHHAP